MPLQARSWRQPRRSRAQPDVAAVDVEKADGVHPDLVAVDVEKAVVFEIGSDCGSTESTDLSETGKASVPLNLSPDLLDQRELLLFPHVIAGNLEPELNASIPSPPTQITDKRAEGISCSIPVSYTYSSKQGNTTWYLVRVEEVGPDSVDVRMFFKRYSDFADLHQSLHASARWDFDTASSVVMPPVTNFLLPPRNMMNKSEFVLPKLPTKGIFGLRHKLELGSFNANRLAALRNYLATISAQCSLSAEPALNDFIGQGGSGQVLEGGCSSCRQECTKCNMCVECESLFHDSF